MPVDVIYTNFELELLFNFDPNRQIPKVLFYSQIYESYSLFPTFPTVVMMEVFAVLYIAHMKIYTYYIGTGDKNNVITMHSQPYFGWNSNGT